MSDEAYKAWALVFNGLTAIGTVGAVITALFLSRKQDEPRVSVSAGVYSYVSDMIFEAKNGILIQAQNVGVRTERVLFYGYNIGVFKILGVPIFNGSSCIVTKPINNDSLGMIEFPSNIEPGQSAYHFLSYEDFNRQQLNFFTEYIDGLFLPEFLKQKRWVRKAALFTAKCCVNTSRDKLVCTRLNPSLRRYILKQYEMGNKGGKDSVDSDQPHMEEEAPTS